jgi:uncharacterized membrane protein
MLVGIVGALAVGGVTGLRTFGALAVLLYARRDWWSVLAGIALLGELIGDLVPTAPARTRALGLVARVIVGGFCAAIVGARSGLPYWAGAICGVFAAIAFAYVGVSWRVRVAPALKLNAVIAALLEDLVAVGAAIAVIGL